MFDQNLNKGGAPVVGSQPITVYDGGNEFNREIWQPLGRPCEIEGCTNEAYNVCEDEYLCFWKGCKKAVCVDHANVRTSF